MAYFHTTQAFHLQPDLNVGFMYSGRAGSAFSDNVNTTIGGRDYEDYQVIDEQLSGISPAHFFCGSGISRSVTGLTGGPVTAFYSGTSNHSTGEITTYLQFRGFSITADELQLAEISSDNRLAEALKSKMLAGNDSIWLSNFSDNMEGRKGNDTIHGGGGADWLDGGQGADSVVGGQGADRIIGGPGADVLEGGLGKAQDTFVFGTGTGSDRITDFQDGIDLIEITSGARNFGQLVVSDHGADVLVTFGTSSILIQHIEPVAITEADFRFT